MIEDAPSVNDIYDKGLVILMDPRFSSYIQNVNKEYYYWDKVKYHVPEGLSPREFWAAVKCSRVGDSFHLGPYSFKFKETSSMRRILHDLDVVFFENPMHFPFIEGNDGKRFLFSSLMEESIASSQMEGANTTRRVAKEMLRKGVSPKDKSQRMIVNNYNTIQFVAEHCDEDLSVGFIKEIHRLVTKGTLRKSQYEGSFRNNDDVVVADGVSGEIAHEPPSFNDVPNLVSSLCFFANGEGEAYMHPIVKAIAIHFMVSFIHPFVDGNGRTARALFYWYMMKSGYTCIQFLAVSRIIYRSKGRYEKSFLYTEHDGLDLGYFVNYNLKVLETALDELRRYVESKKGTSEHLIEASTAGLNHRQAEILRLCEERPDSIFTAKELGTMFDVTTRTLRSDLGVLVERNLIKAVPLNRRLVGYTSRFNK